jgi:hypothetical protein
VRASATLASSVEAIDFKVEKRKTENLRCLFRIFPFVKSGPVHTPRPPPARGRVTVGVSVASSTHAGIPAGAPPFRLGFCAGGS